MPKFRKFDSVDGSFVVVPASYYNRILDSIRSSSDGHFFTRLYMYWLDRDGVMWRYPCKNGYKLERVISQLQFSPEVFMS